MRKFPIIINGEHMGHIIIDQRVVDVWEAGGQFDIYGSFIMPEKALIELALVPQAAIPKTS